MSNSSRPCYPLYTASTTCRAGYAEDSFESTRLVALPRASLVERARSLPMPGCHRGVLELYLRHLDARSHASVEPEGAKL